MTAAGTIPPAKVLVLGAGVAGLAGDRHRAPPRRADAPGFDVRPETAEQVESLGAELAASSRASSAARRGRLRA